VDGSDVVFFGLKQAVDNGVDHFRIKTAHNADVLIGIDILWLDGIKLIKLDPGVFGEKRLAGRDKEQAAFFEASVRIPLISASHSEGFRPPIPIEAGHSFRRIPAMHSGRFRPRIPIERGHLFRSAAATFSERSDAEL
jgi:hypothetical protein